MPKKTRHKHEPNFYETLNPSLPLRRLDFAGVAPIEGTPLWVYPAWIAGSIVLGILLGLAIKDATGTHQIILTGGNVARILDPQYTVADAGLAVAQSTTDAIQGNATGLQGNNTNLHPGDNILAAQYGFSAYGQQGSVNLPAARQ